MRNPFKGFLAKRNPNANPRSMAVSAVLGAVVGGLLCFVGSLEQRNPKNGAPDPRGWPLYIFVVAASAAGGAIVDWQTPDDDDPPPAR